MSTTETVKVSLDLLKQWEDWYGHRIPDAMHDELLALLPKPVRVGDTITGAQFAALPPLSVAIDGDGDVWVRTTPGDATLVQSDGLFEPVDYVTEDSAYLASDIAGGIVVHIGEEAE